MSPEKPVAKLRRLIDERWAVVQPTVYPHVLDGWHIRPKGGLDLLTDREALDFLISVEPWMNEPPIYAIDDLGALLSDRIPPRKAGTPKRYLFFEEEGTVKLETIVQPLIGPLNFRRLCPSLRIQGRSSRQHVPGSRLVLQPPSSRRVQGRWAAVRHPRLKCARGSPSDWID
jgi:hypothetical protein